MPKTYRKLPSGEGEIVITESTSVSLSGLQEQADELRKQIQEVEDQAVAEEANRDLDIQALRDTKNPLQEQLDALNEDIKGLKKAGVVEE